MSNDDDYSNENYQEQKHYNNLKEALLSIKESSSSAVADASRIGLKGIKKYLHIDRPIQKHLQNLIERAEDSDKKQLIIVCGNVGDGKSHLISYLRKKWPDFKYNFIVKNDATESSLPEKTFLEELYETLDPFSDDNINSGHEKIILAINLGTLNNFLTDDGRKCFSKLFNYVQEKKIFEIGIFEDNTFDTQCNFQHVNFCDYNLFELTPEGPKSDLIEKAINKIVDPVPINPFWLAYEKHKQTYPSNCPIRYNYELLQDSQIQSRIRNLLIECIVRNQMTISIRALYNFIYDIIVPVDFYNSDSKENGKHLSSLAKKSYLEAMLPNYIFEHPELSPILFNLKELDPSTKRTEALDECAIKLMVSEDREAVFNKYIPLNKISDAIKEVLNNDDIADDLMIKTFIRSTFFWQETDELCLESDSYKKYMRHLYGWYSGDNLSIRPAYKLVQNSLQKWFGNSPDGHVNIEIGTQQLQYRVSQKIQLNPDPLKFEINSKVEIDRFQVCLPLRFKINGSKKPLEISFKIYELCLKMDNGYCPTRTDHVDFISFSKFMEYLSKAGDGRKNLCFLDSTSGKQYILELDSFDEFNFKEVRL